MVQEGREQHITPPKLDKFFPCSSFWSKLFLCLDCQDLDFQNCHNVLERDQPGTKAVGMEKTKLVGSQHIALSIKPVLLTAQTNCSFLFGRCLEKGKGCCPQEDTSKSQGQPAAVSCAERQQIHYTQL